MLWLGILKGLLSLALAVARTVGNRQLLGAGAATNMVKVLRSRIDETEAAQKIVRKVRDRPNDHSADNIWMSGKPRPENPTED